MLYRRPALVPFCGLLISVGGPEHGQFVERPASQLQGEGQTGIGESAWNGNGGHAGYVVGPGILSQGGSCPDSRFARLHLGGQQLGRRHRFGGTG